MSGLPNYARGVSKTEATRRQRLLGRLNVGDPTWHKLDEVRDTGLRLIKNKAFIPEGEHVIEDWALGHFYVIKRRDNVAAMTVRNNRGKVLASCYGFHFEGAAVAFSQAINFCVLDTRDLPLQPEPRYVDLGGWIFVGNMSYGSVNHYGVDHILDFLNEQPQEQFAWSWAA